MTTVIEQPERRPPPDDYWSQTRRPLVCLVFLLPLLATYEIGVLLLGRADPESLRNGADVWMRTGLQHFGLHQTWLLPALVIAGLLAWHVMARTDTFETSKPDAQARIPVEIPRLRVGLRCRTFGPSHNSREASRISWDALPGMLAESVLFGFALVAAGQGSEALFRQLPASLTLATGASSHQAAALAFVGAGIYEELLFRMCLLPAWMGLFRLSRVPRRNAVCLAVLLTSLMFSLAHHVGPGAEAVTLFPFAFRTLAGIYFSILFLYRGFGITVGCHAAYDLLVGLAFT